MKHVTVLQAELGDYVTGRLAGKGRTGTRTGVFAKDHGDGTVTVIGPGYRFRVHGPEGLEVFPEHKIGLRSTLAIMEEVRNRGASYRIGRKS